MKKLFKKLALMVVALLTFSVGSNYTVKEVKAAENTVELTKFSATAADLDGVASYTTAQGGGTSAPVVNSNQIRLYQNSKGTGGGTLTVKVKEDYALREVVIGSSMKTSIAYTLDAGTTKSSTSSLSANGKYTASELDNSSITFYCMGKDKNSRLYVNYLSVTYESTSVDPMINLTADTKTIYIESWGGPNVANITYELLNTDETSVIWESSDENVATVKDGVVTAVSAGTTTITGTIKNTSVSSSIEISVMDFTSESSVNDYTKLNYSTVGNQIPNSVNSTTAGLFFVNENVNYQNNNFYIYSNKYLSPKTGVDANIYNLNKYSKSISQILIESTTSGLVVYESKDGQEYNEVAGISTKVYDNSTNIAVTLYSFSGNTNYMKIACPSSITSYINISNIWIEFVDRYTVTFDVNGGDSLEESSYNVRQGESVTVSTPNRNGYVFKGWKNGDTTLTSNSLVVNETATYVAQWQVDFSTVETKAQLDFSYSYSEELGESTIKAAYAGGQTANMTEGNQASIVGLDENLWEVVANKGSNNNMPGLNTSGDIRLYYGSEGSNSITFTYKGGSIYSINLEFTGSNYSNCKVLVNDLTVVAVDNEFEINSNSFTITNGNSENIQVRIKSINITCETIVTTYSSFGNVNLRYSATIPTDLFENVESFGFNIAVGTSDMDYPVAKTTVEGDNTSFALVLTDVKDYNSVITVTGYVVVDGERINLGSKTYSVLYMIKYYLEYSSSLNLSPTQVDVLKAFHDEIT